MFPLKPSLKFACISLDPHLQLEATCRVVYTLSYGISRFFEAISLRPSNSTHWPPAYRRSMFVKIHLQERWGLNNCLISWRLTDASFYTLEV